MKLRFKVRYKGPTASGRGSRLVAELQPIEVTIPYPHAAQHPHEAVAWSLLERLNGFGPVEAAELRVLTKLPHSDERQGRIDELIALRGRGAWDLEWTNGANALLAEGYFVACPPAAGVQGMLVVGTGNRPAPAEGEDWGDFCVDKVDDGWLVRFDNESAAPEWFKPLLFWCKRHGVSTVLFSQSAPVDERFPRWVW